MLTSAMIDSRDFIDAKAPRRCEQVLLPAGPKVALHRRAWSSNDHHGSSGIASTRFAASIPDMVLAAWWIAQRAPNCIAACWADNRKVPQIAFKPDWTTASPRPRPSSATTPCLACCRSGSCTSPAPASRTTSPTRRRSSASRCGSSAARKRRPISLRVSLAFEGCRAASLFAARISARQVRVRSARCCACHSPLVTPTRWDRIADGVGFATPAILTADFVALVLSRRRSLGYARPEQRSAGTDFPLPSPPVFRYTSGRAAVVVEGATVTALVTE